ncbi:hypothetical protein AMS68_005250 [Peltaster fructicola]|uniref:ATP-dependent DNA helicase CHL1 n=1 Tax=Peltaster fructicola TaxID=286661 RepID=A0A6H0XY98_9PEZI|nr:hypothetical protein AMS68_005250 [Peltaster fructicola]
MVLLKVTETVAEAVKTYRNLQKQQDDVLLGRLAAVEVEGPIEHRDLVTLSRLLVHHHQGEGHAANERQWRLDTLLTGVTIYIPPPPAKPEPSAEYKALMRRLRNEEEQRQYDRMTEVPQKESFAARLPTGFNPQLAHGRSDVPEIDDVTYQDINRQLTLIINVLVTVIASGVTIWQTSMNMSPKNFYHPFQPYEIQQEFMQAVYDCIEDGKVGIFESPTGTGKSLSLICGSLTWLREHKRKLFDASMQDADADDDEPAWLLEHARTTRHKEALALRAEFEARLAQMQASEKALRRQLNAPEFARKRTKVVEEDINEDTFVLDDYNSDDEHERAAETSTYSAGTAKLLEQLGLLNHGPDKKDKLDNEEEVKVFFCSRTHSQLSQLVGELRRVRLPSTLPPEQSSDAELPERLRQIALGSRKNLCINPRVSKLSSMTAINERCLELQRSGPDSRCQYLPKQDTPDLLLDFRDSALASIRDIEDLALVGKTLGVCPYYASRSAIGPAEVVTLPYPLLLQKASRDALGISIKDSVVVIDEAHNLVSAVESAYMTQISDGQLRTARANLIAYLQKFRTRLAEATEPTSLRSGGKLLPQSLLAGKGIDQINLPKLVRYITDSRIARKVEGYTTRSKIEAGSESHNLETPTLTMLANFALSLINPAAEGSFFWSKEGDSIVLKYLLLDPSQHFSDIVDEARAVILAGGTMSPMSDHIQQLFPHLTDVRTLSCGHIVPASSLLVRTLPADASGSLDFNYRTRSDTKLMQRVGRMLCSMAQNVLGGMVVFFSSYSYLEAMHLEWRSSGILAKLNACKKIFFDSRTHSADATFQAYSEAVRVNTHGAVLCSVIGGKLSEGINFSDELGRCVVVIGLPYPNLETPEWKAKIQYLEQQASRPGQERASISREFAENACMRAVNQAIGRAIRHKNDWAGTVLIDSRYAQSRIQAKLPAWIRGSLPPPTQNAGGRAVEELNEDIRLFFDAHR